jgi:hypothetical protein
MEGFISESPSSQLLSVVQSIAAGVIGSANLPGLTGTFAAAAGAAIVSKAFSGSTPSTAVGEASYVKLLNVRNESDVDFPKRAMIGMVRMFEQGAPFTLRTFFNDSLYSNMVMTSLSFKQTTKEGNSLAFSMGCKKINVTTTFTKDASEFRMQNPAGQSAAAKKLKDKVTKKERSLALDVFGIK